MLRKKHNAIPEESTVPVAAAPAPTAKVTSIEVHKETKKASTEAPKTAKPRSRKKKAELAPTEVESLSLLSGATAAPASYDRGEVAIRAYLLWMERGCPAGSAEEDWLQAERELLHA